MISFRVNDHPCIKFYLATKIHPGRGHLFIFPAWHHPRTPPYLLGRSAGSVKVQTAKFGPLVAKCHFPAPDVAESPLGDQPSLPIFMQTRPLMQAE